MIDHDYELVRDERDDAIEELLTLRADVARLREALEMIAGCLCVREGSTGSDCIDQGLKRCIVCVARAALGDDA